MLIAHCFILATLSTLFLLLALSSGTYFSNLLKLNVTDPSMRICLGLTPLLICLFYAQETHFAIPLVIGWYFISACFLLWFGLRLFINRDRTVRNQILDLITSSVLVSVIYGVFSEGGELATFLNNDIYSWYSVASTLIEKARFTSMGPLMNEEWKTFPLNGYGTNWMLAIIGLFFDEPIKSSVLFLVITSTWLSLIFQWQLVELFALRRSSVRLLSVLPMTSSFFIYIAFNSFFAQILGTIGSALLLSAFIRIYNQPNLSARERVLFISIPVLWSLIVYQSGFVVFQLVPIGLVGCLFLFSDSINKGLKKFSTQILKPYLMCVLLIGLILPTLIIYLVNQTLFVSNVVAGWPLPLLAANSFLALPWPARNLWLFGGATTSQQLRGYGLLLVGLVGIYNVGKKHGPIEEFRRLRAMWIGYILLILSYLSWFFFREPSYQCWKFASFFIFSSSALPLGTIARIFNFFDNKTRNFISAHFPWNLLKRFGLASMLLFLVWINLIEPYQRKIKLRSQINQLVLIRQSLEPDSRVNLDLVLTRKACYLAIS